MKTSCTPALLLGLLYLCFFGYLVASSSQLSSRVATHFDGHGQPNGWMSRAAHLQFMGVFGLGFPLFVPAIVYASRFLPDRFYNLPHRDYWLAPARQGLTGGIEPVLPEDPAGLRHAVLRPPTMHPTMGRSKLYQYASEF